MKRLESAKGQQGTTRLARRRARIRQGDQGRVAKG